MSPLLSRSPSRPVPHPLLLNQTRAATALGLTRFQLWQLERRYRGRFPILRIGRRKRLYDVADVAAFLKAHFGPTARAQGKTTEAPSAGGEE